MDRMPTLQGELETAKRSLETGRARQRIVRIGSLGDENQRAESVREREERYERYKEQGVARCTIRAPQPGMVAYAMPDSRHGNSATVEEAACVRQRQEVLTLPNLSQMQVERMPCVECRFGSSQGRLTATIRVDAFPELALKGSVKSVSVLADIRGGGSSSGAKVYKTIVTIDEEVDKLKPGMTAVVQIDVDRLENVLSVPVQAIVQRESNSWVCVSGG
ncbi:MAG: hypothetical protein U5K37_05245 [Natrialbaceae archaeon]|nr:hypothetical protein [Natrialbaceae archaeon]